VLDEKKTLLLDQVPIQCHNHWGALKLLLVVAFGIVQRCQRLEAQRWYRPH